MMTILIRNANVLHFSDYNVTFQLKNIHKHLLSKQTEHMIHKHLLSKQTEHMAELKICLPLTRASNEYK